MTQTVQTDAFVLRSVDYGDHHVIVTLLARDLGKVSAIARSAKRSRRRFGGALLPLRTLRATLTFKPQRDLGELDQAVVLRGYEGLDASYDKITVASYCTELVRSMVQANDDARTTFDLLDLLYDRVATAGDSPDVLRAILYQFELSLLGVAGHAPSLAGCHRCGVAAAEMTKLRCGRDGQGLVCPTCVRPGERYGVLSADALTVLQYLEQPVGRPPDAIATTEVAGQVRRVLDASLETALPVALRSRGLVDAIFEGGV